MVQITNWLSPMIVDELERVLAYDRFELTGDEILDIIQLVLSFSKIVVPKVRVAAVKRDPADNKYLECALACGAEAVVSGDKHLLSPGKFEGIRIVTARQVVERGW